MGSACSSHGSNESENIDEEIIEDHEKENETKKLLLLGAGESGKSTVFKQALTLYGTGFSQKALIESAPFMINNILTCIKTLIQQSTNPMFDLPPVSVSQESLDFIEETPSDTNFLSEEVINAVEELWKDPVIQAVYEKRAKYQLVDSAGYFLSRIPELKERKMVPNLQDMLHIRVRTTGIAETMFKMGETRFQMMDVGGQRNERKKWIHCFDHVTAVIFVTALSEYDQMLAEVDRVNRMDESISLFSEICNSRWFRDAVPLTVCASFSDYDGPVCDYDASILYIQDKFLEKTQRLVYTHITCATDTKNIEIVFNVVKETIIRNALKTYGLM